MVVADGEGTSPPRATWAATVYIEVPEGRVSDDRFHVRKDGRRFYSSDTTTGLGPDGTFRLGRELDEIFEGEGRNVFAVKVSYWLGV